MLSAKIVEDGFRGSEDGRMQVVYTDDEVYLTEAGVDNACRGCEKAYIIYYLLKRLQSNTYEVYDRNKWDDLIDKLIDMFPEMI